MALSLSKDFIQPANAKDIHVDGVGGVTIADIGVDKLDALRDFYNTTMRPNYILGYQPLFSWMFKNNGGKVAVLLHDKKVIAHQGHVPIIFANGEKEYRGFISSSTFVDANYRRKGLMTILRGNVQSRYEMACSIGGSAMGVALYSSMGYKLYGDFTRRVAGVDVNRCQNIAKNYNSLVRTVEISKKSNDSIKPVEDFSRISDQVDELVRSVFPAKTFFGVKRSAEFFDWRYSSHPVYDYQSYGLFGFGKLKALIVFRREEIPDGDAAVIRITELIGAKGFLNELIAGPVLNQEHSSGIGWIDFFCTNESICNHIKESGFVDPDSLGTVLPIFCNPVDYYKTKYPVMLWAKDETIYDSLPPFQNWYLTKGDGDADRPNKLPNQ